MTSVVISEHFVTTNQIARFDKRRETKSNVSSVYLFRCKSKLNNRVIKSLQSWLIGNKICTFLSETRKNIPLRESVESKKMDMALDDHATKNSKARLSQCNDMSILTRRRLSLAAFHVA